MAQRLTACGSCPFSRKCKSGELGGSPITVYIGQIVGPFFLPCHCKKDYKGNAEELDSCDCQCAGAAIMRRNLGIDWKMPPQLLRLSEEDENVFSTLEEFVAHHCPTLSPDEVSNLVSKAETFFGIEVAKAGLVGRIKPVSNHEES